MQSGPLERVWWNIHIQQIKFWGHRVFFVQSFVCLWRTLQLSLVNLLDDSSIYQYYSFPLRKMHVKWGVYQWNWDPKANTWFSETKNAWISGNVMLTCEIDSKNANAWFSGKKYAREVAWSTREVCVKCGVYPWNAVFTREVGPPEKHVTFWKKYAREVAWSTREVCVKCGVYPWNAVFTREVGPQKKTRDFRKIPLVFWSPGWLWTCFP